MTPIGRLAAAGAIAALCIAVGGCAAADGEVRTVRIANAADLRRALASSRDGQTLVLAPGDYGLITIERRRFTQPLRLIAGEARLQLVIRLSSGIELHGGRMNDLVGRGPAGYAINISRSDHVSIEAARISRSNRGIVIGASSDVVVRNIAMTGMIIDGIDIGSSQRVAIHRINCENFASGTAHPDCVQMWSRPAGVTSDILIADSTSTGAGMQGFTGFNHVRNGIDDGGFDRVTMTRNTVIGSFPQGIALYDCRFCVVTRNRTRRVIGAPHRVSINVGRCHECTVESNDVGP